MNKKQHIETQAIHAGHIADKQFGSLTTPLYQSSTFTFTDVEQGAKRFAGETDGYVYTRLGNNLRVAGTAELSGYDNIINQLRCEARLKQTQHLFPDLGGFDQGEFWAGLRPATPSNLPYIGPTRYSNLWLNTGHGTLGWTMGCGSGKLIADMICSHNRPKINLGYKAFLPVTL
mgnify:CR=1 FL=1